MLFLFSVVMLGLLLEHVELGLEVLIGYDGPRNGGFELYRLPVQP